MLALAAPAWRRGDIRVVGGAGVGEGGIDRTPAAAPPGSPGMPPDISKAAPRKPLSEEEDDDAPDAPAQREVVAGTVQRTPSVSKMRRPSSFARFKRWVASQIRLPPSPRTSPCNDF